MPSAEFQPTIYIRLTSNHYIDLRVDIIVNCYYIILDLKIDHS